MAKDVAGRVVAEQGREARFERTRAHGRLTRPTLLTELQFRTNRERNQPRTKLRFVSGCFSAPPLPRLTASGANPISTARWHSSPWSANTLPNRAFRSNT